MKELVFGALKFDRFSIPEHLADLISWLNRPGFCRGSIL